MSSIKAIGQDDVHRITSGQVIVDLTSAVKELVENSLDADATLIEVVFKNYGLAAIEVSDNGNGISKTDHSMICLKHHTSKLDTFEEVNSVVTYGFRGEAMSSLCAVSNVTITTSTKEEAPRATRLEFGKSGVLQKSSVVSGKKGTVTCVNDFFEPLPVRRKDLVKNARREFQKALMLLQAYAVICVGVRFIVSHIPAKGSKNVVLATKNNTDLKGNIGDVFGSNGMYGLHKVEFEVDVGTKFRIRSKQTMKIRVSGYISNSSFGQGRSATDRQLVFINNRPVSFPKILKAISDEYKQYNHLQFPVILINLGIEADYLDLNVVPDKRTVLIHNEMTMIEAVREEFKIIFSENVFVLPKNTSSDQISRKGTRNRSFGEDVQEEDRDDTEMVELSEKSEEEEEEEEKGADGAMEEQMYNEPQVEIDLEQESDNEAEEQEVTIVSSPLSEEEDIERDEPENEQTEIAQAYMAETAACGHTHSISDEEGDEEEGLRQEEEDEKEDEVGKEEEQIEGVAQGLSECCHTHSKPPESPFSQSRLSSFVFSETPHASPSKRKPDVSSPLKQKDATPTKGRAAKRLRDEDEGKENLTLETLSRKQVKALPSSLQLHNVDQIVSYSHESLNLNIPITELSVGSEDIPIEDITDREAAELGLTLKVSKSDFESMKIVGQFNLGFIIVTRKSSEQGTTDLFIVDQHASDEKYNFEKLQRETTFESQPLVVPVDLDLNPIDELLVIDHREVFARNGFRLEIDEQQPPGRRIRLRSLPVSKKTVFDTSDMNELIHMLKDGGSAKSIRPSKIRSMFAMRACRMSIMVGRPLNRRTMQTVVQHLAGLDKPWNCPHGRPTMRHLMELNLRKPFTDDYRL
ncbi:unnamed protein product [Kuraishia capsulata CBS 1993]|uniref:DNA mismatch repair protein PMS1 n=1 Tax=Kuraishia capsulata CBS 1993 TaxID=1382522 RepID=W6MTD8_9ASCO|nr:uncharacterized protein KUCA_T00004450001 [Kuraishia capsulata CBS 1993]CDK28467.1 unnamed protein product [Kuraishia capsulata CBS 1993]